MVFIIAGFTIRREFYYSLRNKIKKAGLNAEIIDLGWNVQSIEASSEKVFQRIKKSSSKNDIIAHSLGGIIIRHVIKHHPEIKDKIKSIAFVSVPHRGSWSALFALIFPAARDMLPISKNLRGLSRVLLPGTIVNFIPEIETKIWPRKGEIMKNRKNVVILKTNHDSIIKSRDFVTKLIAFIKSKSNRF